MMRLVGLAWVTMLDAAWHLSVSHSLRSGGARLFLFTSAIQVAAWPTGFRRAARSPRATFRQAPSMPRSRGRRTSGGGLAVVQDLHTHAQIVRPLDRHFVYWVAINNL